MKHLCSLLALALFLPFGTARGADWKPAKGPLLTRWAKDVSPDKVLPEYPRPQMVRPDWQSLNGLWEFALGKKEDRKDEDAPLGKKLDGQILVPFPVESALSGVMKTAAPKSDGLRVWYRRTFEVKKEWAGKRLLLHFGAVNWEATVWVNGKQLGTHRGGYDGFSFDITDALKKDGPQELVVGVWNPIDSGTHPRGKQVREPGGIFYTASTGIWQTVWLEPVASAYVEELQITPDFDGKQVRVRLGGAGLIGDARAWARAFDGEKEIASAEGRLGDELVLKVPDARPWSPETPVLYRLRAGLAGKPRGARDEVESYFALRKIEIGKDEKSVTRMLLNGKPYFQVGPLDQGFWPDGLYTAPTDAALKYDIEMTKKLGFNTIRKHVKVEPERWYYWCDKLGVLVWQDMPSGDVSVGPGKGEIKRTEKSAKQYELELERLIRGRGNHPCVVMWVPFNEGWGQYDTVRVVEWVKQRDPSRLVNCASGWNDFPCGDVHDIHAYPGPSAPKPEDRRAAVLGEFGGLGLGVDGHDWSNKTWGYQATKDSADLTRKYERLLRRVHELRDQPGLSAAIYTQTTDVETEANGLLTYDREVVKVDLERVAAANRGDFSRIPKAVVVVPTSQQDGIKWRYTFEKPAEAWFKADFNDGAWKQGPGGFGTKGTPGAVVRTEWKTDDIWLRREFTLPEMKVEELYLLLHHDDDVEVYLNGVLAASLKGWKTDYEETPIRSEALKTLKTGKNVIAIHCHQVKGGQYIDAGFVRFEAPAKK